MSSNEAVHGVLVVDKPSGMTSAKVVSLVKRGLGIKKIGHTGTLDPMATGVLPLCVGEGTKVAGYLLSADKHYDGEFVLGVETDTLDREGKVVAEDADGAKAVTRDQVLSAMKALTGAIEQVPPMYSAIRQNGRRLHSLARAGEVVEREARPVTIHRFELLSFADGHGSFSVEASKGTYVRTLVDDMGRALGCGAHLSELRRTRAGRFALSEALPLETLLEMKTMPVLDPAEAISHLPSFELPSELVCDVADGKRIAWQLVSSEEPPTEPFALLTPGGKALLAIAEVDEEKLRYRRVFNYGLTSELRSSNVPAEIV
jgi:tRNA pseudouridine55 synthase